MANCERCGKEIEGRGGTPRFVVCETEPSGLCCSGYAIFEVELCSKCLEELEKFMEGQDGGDS